MSLEGILILRNTLTPTPGAVLIAMQLAQAESKQMIRLTWLTAVAAYLAHSCYCALGYTPLLQTLGLKRNPRPRGWLWKNHNRERVRTPPANTCNSCT